MKSTGRVLIRGSAARLVSNAVGMSVSFILMPMLITGLGSRNYGIWALAGAFVGFYGLFDLGVNSAVSRFIARALGRSDSEDFNRFFATSFYLLSGLAAIVLLVTLVFPLWMRTVSPVWRTLRETGHPAVILTVVLLGILAVVQALARLLPKRSRAPLKAAVVIAIASFLLALFLSLKSNRDDREMLVSLLLILGINVAFQIPVRSFAGIIESHLRYDINSVVQALENIVRLPLIWCVLVRLHYGLLGLALASVMLETIAALVRVFFAFRLQRGLRFLPRDFDGQRAQVILEYGKHTLIARIADMLRFRATPFLITLIRSVTLVTPFAIAERLNQVVGDIMMSLMSVLTPVFSQQEGRGDVHVMRETYLFTCRIATYAAVMLGGLMILLGGAFVRRWLGPQYAYVTPIMRTLVLGTIFSSAQMPTVGFLYGTSRNKFYAITNIIHGILSVIMISSLILPYGLEGVALGITLPTVLIKFFIQPICACRALKVPMMEFYLRHAASDFLVPLAFLACVAMLAHPFIAPQYGSIFAIVAISGAAFVPYIYLVGFNPAQRIMLLKSVRPMPSVIPA